MKFKKGATIISEGAMVAPNDHGLFILDTGEAKVTDEAQDRLGEGRRHCGAEPMQAEPSRAKTKPSRADPSEARQSQAEPIRSEPSRAEPIRARPMRAELSRTGLQVAI